MEAAKAIILDKAGNGKPIKNTTMNYLQSVVQAKLDGVVPPFYPNDVVRLKKPGGQLGSGEYRILRVWYFEGSRWRLVLENGWSYTAHKFKKVPTTAVQGVKEPAHA